MKTIICDRCGKEIPYKPPYMNCCSKDGEIPSGISVYFWDMFDTQLREVDLCETCKNAIQEFIFNYKYSEPAKASD